MAPVILERLAKRYDNGFDAVREVSLDVASGEFIVLVGPSGCGKTTTLRMVAGLESITAGELRIGGRRVNDVAPKDRDIAMVFQSYALYPHMTVFENMAFGLRLRKLPEGEIRQRVNDVAATLGLTELLDRKPKAMSGGQRQRVAMGRAIVRRPAVFLFDEPLSNLDAKLRLQMRVELAAMHRRLGATSLYVTHDQVEAMTLADRIVLMKSGQVQQIGTPLDLYDKPMNLFVATFMGSPAMNLLPARIEGDRVCGAGFSAPLPAGVESTARAVTLGVRPAQVSIVEPGPDTLAASVEVVEPLGAESYVHCRVGDSPAALKIVARTEGVARVRPGDRVGVAFDASRLHLFDPLTETRV